MAIENVVYHIPKESYDYVIKDRFVDDINNYLLDKLGDCVMKNLVAEGEIVVKLSELCKEEFTPTNSIYLKRQIAWEPLVRCRECKHYNGHERYCEIDHFARENGFCSYGKRRTDYTVFTVNPPKGIETPLKGDVTVFHKKTQK